MKFLVLFASLISFVAASGYYGHHIPARVDIAPGGVETILTHKVVPQVVSALFSLELARPFGRPFGQTCSPTNSIPLPQYTTSYKTPITAPVIAKYPIIGKTLHTSVEHYPVVTHHGYAHGGYAKGGLY